MSDDTDDTDVPKLNPGALDALTKKFTAKLSDGKMPTITRRSSTITIPLSACEPDTFGEDPIITIEALSAEQELACLKEASDGNTGGLMMAKRAMKTLHGAPILKARQRDLIWDCLGFGGRAMLVNEYLVKCTGAPGVDMGKMKAGESDD